MSVPLSIGLDLGGTKTGAALVGVDGTVVDRIVLETPGMDSAGQLEGVCAAAAAALERAGDAHVVGVGAGLAGLVERDRGELVYGPNVALRRAAVTDAITARTGLDAVAANDADCAALAEHDLGAGERCGDLLMVTLGTGIGGGIIAAGAPFAGAHGFAGEIGHMMVHVGGPRCACGERGHWEAVASGRALDRMARDAAGEPAGARILDLAGGDGAAVTGRHAVAAAEAGDPLAHAVVAEYADWVAIGLAGLVQCLDPARVVMGGGVVAAGDVVLGPVRERLGARLSGAAFRPDVPVLAAAFGPWSGAVGAALVAFRAAGVAV